MIQNKSAEHDGRHSLVILEQSSEMGGVQHSTVNLLRTLDRQKWSPILFVPKDGPLTKICKNLGITVIVVDTVPFRSVSVWIFGIVRLPNPFAWGMNLYFMFRNVRLLKGIFEKIGPDVLLTKGMTSHLIGGITLKETRIPVVWHLQDRITDRFFGLYRSLFAYAAEILADRCIADGEEIREQLEAETQSRTKTVLNGVDTERFCPSIIRPNVFRMQLGIGYDSILLAHAARITPWKGQDHLLDAFMELQNKHYNIEVVFIGSSLFNTSRYETRLREKAVRSICNHAIHFSGYRDDLDAVLKEVDVFVYPSLEKDTSPLALLSALATGLPVVAYDIPGVREVIRHEENGLLVPVGDRAKLVEGIQRLLIDGSLRSRLGLHARVDSTRRFSLQTVGEACERILLEAMSESWA